MKKHCKKTISYILIMCLLVQTCVVNFASVFAATTASATQQIMLGNTTIDVDQSLKENADGSYTYSLELSSELGREDKNVDQNVPQNDYFVAKESGTYLIELWGGDGASGSETNYSAGGTGGSGGYVYGTIELEAGEVLYYTLGGDGVQTNYEDVGGGVNGSGGGHGDLGSYAVGGGGGYSAVFKFEEGDFDKYLDANDEMNVDSISEEDRISKYVMIAAGGGGGGAGNGFSFHDPVGTADGGAGGNMSSNNGTLSGDAYAVEGTFFEGEDGKSSGTSFEYIGHGGTNEPGAIADTILTIFKGKEPNDWAGTVNENYAGGGGGAGNFRGGAGGAGFCGGSGGLMTAITEATNVGGGGGGSSFIAKEIEYANITDEAKSKMTNKNVSTTGGMINIAFVDSDDENAGQNIVLDTTISKYFDYVVNENVEASVTEKSDGTTALTISNIDLTIGEEPTTIEITLKPKDGFAGGNNVPLFAGESLEFSQGNYTDEIAISSIPSTTYVNVPLNFELITNNYSYNEAQTEFEVSKLYESYAQTHTDLINNFNSDSNYDFIDSIGTIVVKDSVPNTVTGKIAIDETTRFDVNYTVTLKDTGEAVVGNVIPLESIISKEAVVSILKAGETTLNEATINYSKSLTYDDENGYTLSLNVKGSESESTSIVTKPEDKEFKYGVTTTSYTVKESGYYLIQAWGGNGGDGYNNRAAGGAGGVGGYVSAYGHFNAGDEVDFTIGANGANAEDNNSGGQGGNYSLVSLKEKNSESNEYILIAGGAGGGGNGGTSVVFATSGGSGESVTDTNNTLDELSKYLGNAGEIGDIGIIVYGGGGSGGSAGNNYYNSTKLSQDTTNNSFDLGTSTDYTNVGGGAVYITCLQLDEEYNDTEVKNSLESKLSNYIFNAEISKYFAIDAITVTNADDSDVTFSNEGNENNIVLKNISPTLSEAYDENTRTYTYNFEVNINITLTPKEGFLGGNDVPVLVYGNKYEKGMQISQTTGTDVCKIDTLKETDFANVALLYTINSADLSTYDHTYIYGTDGIAKTSLYSLENIDGILNEPYDWQDDYVKFVKPGADLSDSLKPENTTTYDITAGIQTTSATKAVVIGSVDSSTITKPATIYVNYQATYGLTNMTTSAVPTDVNGKSVYAVDPTTDYVVTLSPENGYLLPDDIEVTKADDNTAINFTYDNETGELVIPKDQLTENIIITAEGKVVTYKLIYAYETAPGSGQMLHIEEYAAGATIRSYTYEPNPSAGYEFKWDWATDDGKPLTTMPANNHTVVGKYVANEYTLTINYIDENGNKLFNSHTEKVQYKRTYSVKSPEKAGYLPDQTTVSGTMPAMDYEINVTYTPTANKLNIIYVFDDTGEEHSRHTANYDTDATFKVTSPIIEGYTASQSEVSGTMTADGVTVYVYYTPNKYNITFDDEGGNLSDAEKTRTVVYNNLYGYIYSKVDDVETLTYTQFPEPTKLGYTFGGWYTEANGQGSLVKEDTTVTITDGQTLYAHWVAKEYTVTVEYQYEDGTTALETHKETLAYGDSYSIVSPELTGYTPGQATVSGKIGAQNVKVIVTYKANEYTLTIHYEYQDGSEVATDYVAKVKYGTQYSVTSPTIDGYTASSTVVTGTMPANDREITVIYYEILPDVSVTVTWGDLSFDYNRGQWDTESLTYGADSITPVTNEGNTITVTNNEESETNVEAEIVYESADKYSTLIGYFTPENKSDSETQSEKVYTTEPIKAGSSATTYLWLKGTLDKDVEGTITSGTCSVTIRATTESEEGGN